MPPLRARAPARGSAGPRFSPGCSPMSMRITIFRHADQGAMRVASQTPAWPRTSAYFTRPRHGASLHRHAELGRRAGACLLRGTGALHRVRGLDAGTALLTGPPLRLVNGRQASGQDNPRRKFCRNLAGLKERTGSGVRKGRGARSCSYRRGSAGAHAPKNRSIGASARQAVPERGRSFVGRPDGQAQRRRAGAAEGVAADSL